MFQVAVEQVRMILAVAGEMTWLGLETRSRWLDGNNNVEAI